MGEENLKGVGSSNAGTDGIEQFSPEELQELRKTLLAKRQEIAASQASQLNALNSAEGHHLADLEEMGDSSDTDSLCEIMQISSSTLEQVDRALERIDDGTYGSCEGCQQPINRTRLQYLPFVNLCVDCQRKQEQHQESEAAAYRLEESQ